MKLPGRGAFTIIGSALVLAGCIAPMTTQEAQGVARTRLTKYCNGRCGALALAHTQKIKGRWLVDFDAPRQKFTVIVDGGGNSQISVWDKSRDATGQ